MILKKNLNKFSLKLIKILINNINNLSSLGINKLRLNRINKNWWNNQENKSIIIINNNNILKEIRNSWNKNNKNQNKSINKIKLNNKFRNRYFLIKIKKEFQRNNIKKTFY